MLFVTEARHFMGTPEVYILEMRNNHCSNDLSVSTFSYLLSIVSQRDLGDGCQNASHRGRRVAGNKSWDR